MITNVRGHGQVEYRSFSLTDMVKYGWTDLRSGSVMSETEIRGVPAITRAARIRAEAIATLKLRCWQGDGPNRERVTNAWQADFFANAANEWQTRFGFWDTVGESLAFRNNAYVWKLVDPLSGRVIDWYALHPDQVKITGPLEYQVTVKRGFIDPVGRGEAVYAVNDSTIIHFRGHGHGGELEAPSPMRLFRETLGAAVQRKRHEVRMWSKGTAIQQAILFPRDMTRQQVLEWRDAYRSTYEGTEGETTIALGGGADIKPIGLSLADAQYAELARLTVHDAAMIMGVPANLLGVQEERPVPNLEQDLAVWLRFGLGPELERIEATLAADQQLFPKQGRSIYPMFDTDGFVRGDLLTEATVLVSLVQAGIMLPDEARTRIWGGLDSLPEGVGMIPQITPVGGAPNPNPTPVVPVDAPDVAPAKGRSNGRALKMLAALQD